MISIRDMSFEYPDSGFSLRAGKLDIDSGQTAAIIGPSGSGKTTLLHIAAGILLPITGTVRVSDTQISHQNDAVRRAFRIANIGLIFQEFELLEYLTVRQNILLPYRINPALKLNASVRNQAAALADATDISETLDRRPDRLSQGQRQRVAICRALVTGPKIILADEPTGNLDPQISRTIVQVLLEQAARRDATVLMVTHDHSLLDRFDRIIDLEDLQ
ncbi:MAG: ABC transporter ATP-binding protein [Phycisphaerae bacterium]|jgi:putative ABC transport system ATP-binding protein|nr:ABC transporter ATP-binding protein [Phycisphaerae bacterium]